MRKRFIFQDFRKKLTQKKGKMYAKKFSCLKKNPARFTKKTATSRAFKQKTNHIYGSNIQQQWLILLRTITRTS